MDKTGDHLVAGLGTGLEGQRLAGPLRKSCVFANEKGTEDQRSGVICLRPHS